MAAGTGPCMVCACLRPHSAVLHPGVDEQQEQQPEKEQQDTAGCRCPGGSPYGPQRQEQGPAEHGSGATQEQNADDGERQIRSRPNQAAAEVAGFRFKQLKQRQRVMREAPQHGPSAHLRLSSQPSARPAPNVTSTDENGFSLICVSIEWSACSP